MLTRIPPSLPAPTAELPPAPHESPSTGPRPGPLDRPAPGMPGPAPLKRRILACLPCGGAPGGAEAPMRPRVQLPLPGDGQAQPDSLPAPRPVSGKLLWPDGSQSKGQVSDTPDGPMFEVASRKKDPVLIKRGHHKPALPRDRLPAALPVVAKPGDPSGRQFVPRLPQMVTAREFLRHPDEERPLHDGPVSGLLYAAGTPRLKRIVQECGATGDGLDDQEAIALKHLLRLTLREAGPQCADPQAVAHAAQALGGRHCEVNLRYQPDLDGAGEPRLAIYANFDATITRDTVTSLSPGKIWHVQFVHNRVEETGGHSLGLAVQKQADGRVRLSVINSNGWPMQPRARGACTPGVFKTMGQDEAVAAIQDLLSGGIPPRPEGMSMRDWTFTGLGRPLLTWFKGAGPADAEISTDFHGTGRPLASSPQKTEDCTSESLFAFLATVLPPADYKLAKAACLNTLVQICDQLEPPGTAAANSPLQKARRRLQERITSSLSGHMVAATPQAPSR
jgi:hypothetical protein